jgi:hypothetical protein
LPPVDQGEVTFLDMSTRAERLGGTEGNEILTSATAVVLTLLLIAEAVTIVLIGDLLSAHMFIGMALIPPVLLKLGSTGYRLARYYTGARIYREKGPPLLVLRLLAPVLVITTIIIFATGVALLVSGHRSDLVFNLHKVSFIVWSGCFGVHFLAHTPQTARALQTSWRRSSRRRIPGSELRLALLIASIGGGLALALAVLSLITGWHGERRHHDRRRALTGSVAPGAPGQGAQPGVDRREVAIGHDARREEPRAVDVAELLELDAAREARAAQALGLVAVTARAAKPAARERLPARRGRSGPLREGDVELADAAGGLGELASGVDADAVVVGHAATEVALGEDRHEREQASGQERMPVSVPVLLDASEPPAGDDEDDRGDADAEPEVQGADAERMAAQLGLRLAPDEQAGGAGEDGAGDGAADDPGFGPHQRVAAEVGAPAEQHDHVERDDDDRQVRGGAVQLGEMRHAAAR